MTRKGWIVWTVWLLAIGVSFAVLEANGWSTSDTLSRYVSTIGKIWPLAIYLFGFLNGGLAVHFFWPWQKNPLGKGGG